MTILTVTMNPSIDIAYYMGEFTLDNVNRVSRVNKSAGGKGLNVSRVLKELKVPFIATGLIGGELGTYIQRKFDEVEIEHDFFKISQETRNCIAILHDTQQTEILESGPTVNQVEADAFLKHFEKLVKKVEVVVISGSLPNGLPTDYYLNMLKVCDRYEKRVVLDTSSESLFQVLQGNYKPFVIKPNIYELSQILNKDLDSSIEVLKGAVNADLFQGIEWVIVSLGSDGAFAKHGEKFYKVDIPKISVVNPVGSGDSTVAGIVESLRNQSDDVELLKHANVLGMLNAQEAITGHINLDNYKYLYQKVEIVEV